MENEKIQKEQLDEMGIELLSKEELRGLEPGELIDCDALLQSLLHEGYNAEYKNVYSDKVGFIAVFFIDGEEIGAVEGFEDTHMLRKWEMRD